jgi:hypothetical protein
MPDDPLSAAERYRKAAAEFADLAKTAANPFFYGYYERLAQRYLLHAENQMKLSRIIGVTATDLGRQDTVATEPKREAPDSSDPPPSAPRAAGRRRRRRSTDQIAADQRS